MVNVISAPSIPVEGEWVGKYRLLNELEIGRPGTVFAAEEPDTRRAVVVRVRPRPLAGHQGFLEAARKLMRLDHPHVAAILDAGETDGRCFLVTEFPQGQALQDRLKREHCLPLKESLRIAREIAAGLVFAHAHGLIHGDLSPATVWLEQSGRARVLGFDARTDDNRDSILSRLDDLGTPGCLSPEQAAGEPITPAADLFGLGCILYQMVSGERPFRGERSAALSRAVVFEHPTRVREINPHLPESLDNLLARLLAKLPADRPSATAVERQIMQWLDPLAPAVKPLDALAYPASRRILETIESMKAPMAAPSEVSRLHAPLAVRTKVKRTWWIDTIAAILLLAGAVSLYLWWKASNDQPRPAPAAKSSPNS